MTISTFILSTRQNALVDFESALEAHGLNVSWANSGKKALDKMTAQKIELIVADEILVDMTGIQFAKELMTVNPMVNCAVVSRLSAKAFHDATEGLGLLMQLPSNPDGKDAERLLTHLKKIQ